MEEREIDSIITLFDYYREAAGIDEEHYDENKVLKTVREYNIRPNLFFRVAYNGLRPIGLIGGFLSEDPIETEITATIQFNFLIDEFNSVENYAQLIAEFQNWSKALGVKQVRALDIGNNITRLNDVYDILGFNPVRVVIMNKEIE